MAYETRPCNDCNGRGQVYDFQQPGYYPNDSPRQPGFKSCGGCGGYGLKGGNYKSTCYHCNGRGVTSEPDEQGEPQPRGPRGPRPPSEPPPETFELNWFGKTVIVLVKVGLVYLALLWVLSISVVNNFVHREPRWWAHSGVKEELQKIPGWFVADVRGPAKAIGYPPVKGVWAGRIECGKANGEARLTLNGPVNDRVAAFFNIKLQGDSRPSKYAVKLEGRIVKDKLLLDGSGVLGIEGYHAVKVIVEFENFRPTQVTGAIGAPSCEAARFTLRRIQ